MKTVFRTLKPIRNNWINFIKTLVVCAVLAVSFSGCAAGTNETGGPDDTDGNRDGGKIAEYADVPALGIGDIKDDPLSFGGEIKLTGIVSEFSEQDPACFGVMDTRELMLCKNLYCGAYALPVRYSGGKPIPELADLIYFIGSFAGEGDEIYFEIVDFEVKQNVRETLSNTKW